MPSAHLQSGCGDSSLVSSHWHQTKNATSSKHMQSTLYFILSQSPINIAIIEHYIFKKVACQPKTILCKLCIHLEL